jgi:heme-degrading monooxygenase HmoA
MKPTRFVYIWKYIVKEEYIEQFIHAYNEEGDWVKLFRKSRDYIQTKLLYDINDPLVYITLDYWENKKARDHFIKSRQSEYDEIDTRCEDFTIKEELIGEYFLEE